MAIKIKCTDCGNDFENCIKCVCESEVCYLCPDCIQQSGFCVGCGEELSKVDFVGKISGYCVDCADDIASEEEQDALDEENLDYLLNTGENEN